MTDGVETARPPRYIGFAGYSIPIVPQSTDSPFVEEECVLSVSAAAAGVCPREHEAPPFPRMLPLVPVSRLQ
ncbi:hypothetical protein AGR4A_Lc10128 [Agrobacterium tumefaciens str. B6]|uniref:Uncharacterized protein n=1 Tax=Agrobacterium tumefaciens str. B6 TaxID=1183423 RepID=A0A822V6Z2_AGRTU|nr:hypothetical protein AGR4A_Lc10128 [Agrobacterium tumefaciens str. B6]